MIKSVLKDIDISDFEEFNHLLSKNDVSLYLLPLPKRFYNAFYSLDDSYFNLKFYLKKSFSEISKTKRKKGKIAFYFSSIYDTEKEKQAKAFLIKAPLEREELYFSAYPNLILEIDNFISLLSLEKEFFLSLLKKFTNFLKNEKKHDIVYFKILSLEEESFPSKAREYLINRFAPLLFVNKDEKFIKITNFSKKKYPFSYYVFASALKMFTKEISYYIFPLSFYEKEILSFLEKKDIKSTLEKYSYLVKNIHKLSLDYLNNLQFENVLEVNALKNLKEKKVYSLALYESESVSASSFSLYIPFKIEKASTLKDHLLVVNSIIDDELQKVNPFQKIRKSFIQVSFENLNLFVQFVKNVFFRVLSTNKDILVFEFNDGKRHALYKLFYFVFLLLNFNVQGIDKTAKDKNLLSLINKGSRLINQFFTPFILSASKFSKGIQVEFHLNEKVQNFPKEIYLYVPSLKVSEEISSIKYYFISKYSVEQNDKFLTIKQSDYSIFANPKNLNKTYFIEKYLKKKDVLHLFLEPKIEEFSEYNTAFAVLQGNAILKNMKDFSFYKNFVIFYEKSSKNFKKYYLFSKVPSPLLSSKDFLINRRGIYVVDYSSFEKSSYLLSIFFSMFSERIYSDENGFTYSIFNLLSRFSSLTFHIEKNKTLYSFPLLNIAFELAYRFYLNSKKGVNI